ncbi:MAG TPA: hypothetical protein VGE17_04945, partial [Methylophilus sp.]
ALADCTNPAATAGKIQYNSTQKIFQYCADTVWKRMNINPGSGSGGCANPTTSEGQMLYNLDHRVLQGCAGNVFRPFGPVGGQTRWISLHSRNQHVCGVQSNGTLWCWGANNFGQLGNGATSTFVNFPVQESTKATDWKSVTTGYNHSCGLKNNGSIWCWGLGGSGELGDGTNTNRLTPVRESTNATNWRNVSAGANHTCAVKTDNTLYCWGAGGFGRLGTGNTSSQASPTRESLNETTWGSVEAGDYHTCGTQTDGTAGCWGLGTSGQIGNGNTVNSSVALQESSLSTNWALIKAGGSQTCGVKTNGSLWCWGYNGQGQLGNGNNTSQSNPTRESGNATNWKSVTTNNNNTCAVKTNGTLWCWGINSYGQVNGNNLGTSSNTPFQEITGATNWDTVISGNEHVCATKTDGALYCWGNNSSGALGTEIYQDSYFTPRYEPSSFNWAQVSTASDYSCGIKTNGTLWCWGANDYGQHGNGTLVKSFTPVQESTGATHWKSVSVAAGYACAVTTDGKIYCWGSDSTGALGNGASGSQTSPMQEATGNTNWVSVSTGSQHACGLRSDNTLWCWGADSFGQLGNGAGTTTQQSAVQVTSPASWLNVSAGYLHTCAVNTENKLYCWGYDSSGQLGNGATVGNQLSPNQESSAATDWKSVSAGTGTCAVKTNGTLYCWGSDSSGQLGNGAAITANQISPSQEFSGATDWESAMNVYTHSCGLKQNGDVWCWGANNNGQVGDGTTNNAVSPVYTMNGFKSLAQGYSSYTTCGITIDSRLVCWGSNSQGQAGQPPYAVQPTSHGTCTKIGNTVYKGGSLLYNTTHKLLQYCDGVGWVGIGGGAP